jgi:hypothetical protein
VQPGGVAEQEQRRRHVWHLHQQQVLTGEVVDHGQQLVEALLAEAAQRHVHRLGPERMGEVLRRHIDLRRNDH